MTGEPLDFVTVLTSKGLLATKRINRDAQGMMRIEPYGNAARFSIREVGVSDIDQLVALLESMPGRSFIVRGQPRDGIDYRDARRRLHDRRNADGTVTPATLQPAARHWLPLDIDHLDSPAWLDDPIDDPDQTVEHVVERLPPEFHGATCFWQFTSSHALKPGIGIRLFFWTDRPLTDWELKQWLADAPVDPAIFAPAQPIYVARPIFVGMPDPVPFRSGVWRGDRDAITPPRIERKVLRAPAAHPPGSGGSGYECHRARIGDHDGGAGFHGPTKAAVAAWFARHGAEGDTAWLRADLERSVREAPRDPAKHDDVYIQFRVRDLDTLIEAIRRLEAAKAEAQPESVEPAYPAPMESVAAARQALRDFMDRFATAALAWNEPVRQMAA